MRFITFVFLFITLTSYAQQDAWVYFTDKENVSESIANPISILTQRALDRKERHGIIIDERDVPVNENYISLIKAEDNVTVLAKSKWNNCIYVRGTLEGIQNLETLNFVSDIVFADRSLNTKKETLPFIKNDPKVEPSRTSFTYGATLNQTTQLNVQPLHENDFTGNGVIIAVMDSGFPSVDTQAGFKRTRDAGKLLDGYDFVNREEDEFAFQGSSHGTRVLSDIVGFIQDQFVGTAPDASVYCFITEESGDESPAEESYWVEAAERADSLGVDVINTSLGYRTFEDSRYDYTYEDMDGETTFISRGATLAFQKGIMVVTSAGNSGAGMISAPADSPGVLTVGAIDANEVIASFSSIGPSSDGRVKPDVVAQGRSSAVIDQNGNITTNNGTSFSSPIMAGAVASYMGAFPELTNAQVLQNIRAVSDRFTNPSTSYGYGLPDFGLLYDNSLSNAEYAFAKAYVAFPNPVNDQLTIVLPEDISQAEIVAYTLSGQRVLSARVSLDQTTIDMSKIQSGIYIAEIISGTDRQTIKIVKQ